MIQSPKLLWIIGKWHGVAGNGMVWISLVGCAIKCNTVHTCAYCVHLFGISMCTVLMDVLLKLFLLLCLPLVCLRFAKKSQPPPWLLSPCKQNRPVLACPFRCSFVRSLLIHPSTHWLMGAVVPSYFLLSVRSSVHACAQAFMHESMFSFQAFGIFHSISLHVFWCHEIYIMQSCFFNLVSFQCLSLSLSKVSSPLNPCPCECMLFSCSSSHCICFILLMSCHSCLFIQCMQSFKRSSNQLFIQESWAIHANKIHINKQAHYTMHKVLVSKTSLHKPCATPSVPSDWL